MQYRRCLFVLVIVGVLLGTAGSAFARMSIDAMDRKDETRLKATAPAYAVVGHRVGKIELGVVNNGTFGNQYAPGQSQDYFTGQPVPSCEYPKGSNIPYLFGAAFWIGAVVGRDTLVSTGADGWSTAGNEFHPDELPFGEPVYRSIKDPTQPEYEDAVSEEDYVMVYYDTLTDGVDADFFGRPHRPLYIEVTQNSFAWSYSYAEDFVLFDYQIKNIGTELLEDVYMGVYVDADVGSDATDAPLPHIDDICGFVETYPAEADGIPYQDTIFLAFIADNDGDPNLTLPSGPAPCPNVTGTRIVRTPAEELDVSFNWWIGNGNPDLDFGPRERANVGRWREDWREFRTGGLGTPEGDANKYYSLRNREFDYDQVFTASIDFSDTLWNYPDQNQAADFSDGYDTRYLLSFGPFDINPGQTLPISFAYVAGENLHRDENNITNLPDNPDVYYAGLDFDDIALNSRWASWVYDNPGVDTNDDGDSGRVLEERELVRIDTTPDGDSLIIDTVYNVLKRAWIQGDGVPDFKGAAPPPAPELWVTLEEDPPDGYEGEEPGTISVRFNGFASETAVDVFSGGVDFEGYRVYLGRDNRAASFQLMTSYDRENYNKLVFESGEWKLKEIPYTLTQLRCEYADSCGDTLWHPLDHPITNPIRVNDSSYAFEPQDFNVSELGLPGGLRKRYPDSTLYPRPAPGVDPDSMATLDTTQLTADGYFKYYEYEFEINDLLPTVPYWISVTAFDYGSPQSGLESLETSVTENVDSLFSLANWTQVQDKDLEVYVYPNPYRLDAQYRARGFEGRTESDRPPDRTREVHFANLPPVCTIRIYTLDGDLVREIEHNQPEGSGYATHETWNLITRNTQLAVSGLYYWTVESEDGETQIGTLAIIM